MKRTFKVTGVVDNVPLVYYGTLKDCLSHVESIADFNKGNLDSDVVTDIKTNKVKAYREWVRVIDGGTFITLPLEWVIIKKGTKL